MLKSLQVGVVTISVFGLVGCSNLPGNDQQQGAVIGGASGAAIGAAVTHNHALGAIIGGAAGAAGGYVVGKNKDRIMGTDNSTAEAERRSQETPATAAQARNAPTADLNNDGFVTLDEVVAMRQAGVPDDQMVQRLRATNQIFTLTEEQRRYLLDRGVSPYVVDQMASLNQSTTPAPNYPPSGVISRPVQ